MLEKLRDLALRYDDLQAQLTDPAIYGDAGRLKAVNQELKELSPVVETYQAYRRAERDRAAAEEMLSDPELKEMAQEEMAASRAETLSELSQGWADSALAVVSAYAALPPEIRRDMLRFIWRLLKNLSWGILGGASGD